MPTMDTVKQVFYSPPMTLLPKRKDSAFSSTITNPYHHHHPHQQHHHHPHPDLTVTIPFVGLSSRLSGLDARRLSSGGSIRRSRSTPRATPRTTSLPRLVQPSSARPSTRTNSKSTATASTPGSEAKRTPSGWEESEELVNAAVVVAAAEEEVADVVVMPPTDGEDHHHQQEQEEEVLSPEEDEWRRQNTEKCMEWLSSLPDKFSSMHVVQNIVHNPSREHEQVMRDTRSMFLM